MDRARIFNSHILVYAQDVFDEKVNKENEFVDVEEDFRVTYVSKAKNNGRPYFRIYYSREDYKLYSPKQIERRKILDKMRHFKDGLWHRGWENRVSSFTKTEKAIKNEKTNKYKIADAYYEEAKTEIEFQHSYIAFDFEERNDFYNTLGIATIWLYDLTEKNAVKVGDGTYKLLEDNSKGFFRIAENPDNLKKQNVFIQTKDHLIYHIKALGRKEIDSKLKSTVRPFKPEGIYTPEQFVDQIKNKSFPFMNGLKSIWELWDKRYYWMAVENTETGKQIIIFRDPEKNGEMKHSTQYKSLIAYQYITWDSKNNTYTLNTKDFYNLSNENGSKKVWKLLRGFVDSSYYTEK